MRKNKTERRLIGRKPDYIPPQRPYEMMHLIIDLIKFARYMLIPKGRLVFFLPTVTEDYDAVDIPFVDGMKELKWGEGSVQDFNKWGRRVSGVSSGTGSCAQLRLYCRLVSYLRLDDYPSRSSFPHL